MTVDERYDELRRAPFWQVQAVFDPDGEGGDFAYTIGLHERGLPELHLWARPTLGEDPGHDWMFSIRDRTEVLNELAAKLVVGEICVGSEVVDTFDGGLATVRFRVDPPGDRGELEAFGIAPGALVLPVRWSLHRLPEGSPLPVAEGMRRRLEGEVTMLRLTASRGARAPRGWEVPEEVDAPIDFSEDQPFGPLTPLVRARATQLWQADDETLSNAVLVALSIKHVDSLGHRSALAAAAARPVGRRTALERLHREVHELIWWLTERPAAQRRWRGIMERLVPPEGHRSQRERKRLEKSGAGLLHDLALSCLSVDAVADVAEGDLLLPGRGPWAWAFDGTATDAWWADDAVQDSVRDLLRPLGAWSLIEIAARHVEQRLADVAEAGYADVARRLTVWSWLGPAACAWEHAIASLPGWEPYLDEEEIELLWLSGGASMPPIPALHEWASCVTAAITHRDRLSEDELRTFVAPFADLLPDLAILLREGA